MIPRPLLLHEESLPASSQYDGHKASDCSTELRDSIGILLLHFIDIQSSIDRLKGEWYEQQKELQGKSST